MKKKKITVIVSILFGVLLTVFAVLSTSAYSDNDPLITLSYLEEIFAPSLKDEIIAEVSGITPAENEEEYVPAISESEETPESVDSAESVENVDSQQFDESKSYTLLELSLGQTVMADSICEFIVRPGSRVAAISPFPTQGIADITNGVEVLSGETISINAYCLIPRGADGRGLSVISEKAYIMIRGDYTIG
ncbi:MAG: hypothetical protein IJW06_01795 [Clostridia bacterium]|nr:hypothetical protein [Clostridia bacterium]